MTEKRKTNSVTINFTLSLDDENPRIRKIASILKEGRAIDNHSLFVIKGKDLCLYAIEVFDHLNSQRPPMVLAPSQEDPTTPKSISHADALDAIEYSQKKTEEAKDVKDALAGMGLEDFVNG